jgi:hypothetical protein
MSDAVLQKPTEFSEIQQKPTELSRSKFKNRRILFTVSKFQTKDKNQKNICKKTRSNSKVTGEEFFIKPSRLG